jgi:hypothetical protein
MIAELSDEKWLISEYVEQKKSASEIGKTLGVSRGPVNKALKSFGIQMRSGFEGMMLAAPPLPLLDRFFERAIPNEAGCYIWNGAVTKWGYGNFYVRNRPKVKHTVSHKWIWEFIHGPTPDGLELHHSCENKLCVNPAHLELLTPAEHSLRHADARRKTHCYRGHLLEGENVSIRFRTNGRSYQVCRECERINRSQPHRKEQRRVYALKTTSQPEYREQKRVYDRERRARLKACVSSVKSEAGP